MSPFQSLLVPTKLVLLVTSAVSYYAAHTPPNPESPPEDRVATGQPFDKLVRPIAWTSKIVVCLAFASEFFVIFINAYPQVLSTSSTASELSSSLCPRTPDTVALLSLPLSFWIAALVTLACALVRLWCFHTMGNFFLYEVAVLRSHKLVTTGPYSIVRHPGYTSAILSVLGVMVMHLSYGGWNRECGIMSTSIRFGVWWFFSVGTMSLISLWRRCGFEDVMLRQKFREEWEEWRKDVPYRICPGVY